MRLHQRADDDPSRITVKAAIVAALRLAAERVDQIAQGPSFPFDLLFAFWYAGLRRHFGRCFLLGHKSPAQATPPGSMLGNETSSGRPVKFCQRHKSCGAKSRLGRLAVPLSAAWNPPPGCN